MRSSFELPMDLESMHFTQGSVAEVLKHEPNEIASTVCFVAPIPVSEIDPQDCEVETDYGHTHVRFFVIADEQEDLIFQNTRDIVLVADENRKPFVPTRQLTDNK